MKTGGPDPFRFYVKTYYGKKGYKYKLFARARYGRNITWYKKTKWNAGYTQGYYGSLVNCKDSIDDIKSIAGSLAMKLVKEFIKRIRGLFSKQSKRITVSIAKEIFPFKVVKSIYGGINYVRYGFLVLDLVSYVIDINQAQYFYNKI